MSFFEEEMPAWSYGNRLYLNGWRNEKGRWINGVYRTTSVNFYRKWAQGWPLYRHSLAVCIKKMAFPKDKVQEGERYTSEDMLTIEENDAQVNNAFKLKYLEKTISVVKRRTSCTILLWIWKNSIHQLKCQRSGLF